MNRNDLLELILDHANKHIPSKLPIWIHEFYIANLMAMSDIELAAELDQLETIAVSSGY
jgi:hypothetical protein